MNTETQQQKSLSRFELTRHTVLATALVGTGIIYIFVGRTPGWKPFLAGSIIAFGYLLATLSMWKGSILLGLLSLAIVEMGLLWSPDKPLGSVLGIVIAALNIVIGLQADEESKESGPSDQVAPVLQETGNSSEELESGGAIYP